MVRCSPVGGEHCPSKVCDVEPADGGTAAGLAGGLRDPIAVIAVAGAQLAALEVGEELPVGVVVAAALLKPVAVALPLVGRDGLKPVVAESDLLTVACAEHDAAVAEHRYVNGLAGDHEVVAVEQPPAGKSDVERAATEERAMCRRGAAADLGDAPLVRPIAATELVPCLPRPWPPSWTRRV
ncbi:hypothetical protein AD006_03275 [Pseudonocardia sp. EC080610-09]|uniref:hypothetical protein n=1 Tax=unclassified Pseudonocardia TaxID=2619320 RepID=UPI0006CB59E9|nr:MULTISPECIES: hypothetical protein [unclassified Pseudonocardia]ALE75219.1 hypothetical protein FRP1_24085 [Pseudonocardia sp. EC080625-04]ALL74584.1 hypothetical protein AD006_03275 [Pseudonocardia sp. EC080610-09]ALL81604.1 hypothetical protein AD017_11090 [Pseudonocardia sp. EC080619-01]